MRLGTATVGCRWSCRRPPAGVERARTTHRRHWLPKRFAVTSILRIFLKSELMKSLILLAMFTLSLAAPTQDDRTISPADLAVQVLSEGATSLDPKDMLVWVDLPRSVKKGDSLTLRITVENAGEATEFNLQSVDLDGSFLIGFRIESVTPTPAETDDSFNVLTLEYPLKIAAGETVDFVLEMIAIETGVHIGEASIWNEENFVSRYVQCKVFE